MKKFNLGDEVKWSSSSNGSMKEKIGQVVLIVPSDRTPMRKFLEEDFPGCTAAAIDGSSMGRDHESYIIRVRGATSKQKPKLYWPRVSKLELVHPF